MKLVDFNTGVAIIAHKKFSKWGEGLELAQTEFLGKTAVTVCSTEVVGELGTVAPISSSAPVLFSYILRDYREPRTWLLASWIPTTQKPC